jgi:hypothetical protein
MGTEVSRHLAGQGRQRGLRGRIGRSREGMPARAGDRGDVHDGTLGRNQLIHQPARQHDRCEEIDLEHRLPVILARLDGIEPCAARLLRADGGIVDQRMQTRALRLQALLHGGNCGMRVRRGGKIDDDMVIGAGIPGAILGERLSRTGDDPPACGGESFHRCMADAARCAGEDQRLPFAVGGRVHG